MAVLYTLGEWTVEAGQEDAFVAAWQELAEWTEATVVGSAWAKLLRDRNVPQRFVSFGPWTDDDAVAAWRQHPDFKARVDKIQQLVESFVPHTMDLATQVGPDTPDP